MDNPDTSRVAASSSLVPQHDRLDLSLSLSKANLISVPLAVISVLLVLVPFSLVWGVDYFAYGLRTFFEPLFFVPAGIFGIVLHEILHGAGWIWFGKVSPDAIRFGFHWKSLTPFAHCTVPVTAWAYRLALVLPALVLGVTPAIVGLVTAWAWAVMFGALFLAAASGDLLVLWVIRSVERDRLVKDHPTRAGCVVLE